MSTFGNAMTGYRWKGSLGTITRFVLVVILKKSSWLIKAPRVGNETSPLSALSIGHLASVAFVIKIFQWKLNSLHNSDWMKKVSDSFFPSCLPSRDGYQQRISYD